MEDDLVEAILDVAETGDMLEATHVMAAAIDGCAGFHCTFTTSNGIRRQIAYALTPSEVGERLKSPEFQRPETNPIAAGFMKLRPGRMTPVEQFVDMRAYHESQLYQELIEPYHTPNISSMMIPGRFGILSFGLGQEAGVKRSSLRRAERMAFHVARALDLYSMSKSPGEGAFLVDEGGYLAGTGDIGVRRLSLSTLTVPSHGAPVTPIARAMEQAFRQGLIRAARGETVNIILPDTEGRSVRVRLSPGPDLDNLPVVWVHARSTTGPDWSREALSAVHGLTPREASVVLELLTGATVEEIAARLGLTERSVRTYLSGAFSRTQTGSQSSLVAKLLGF